MKIIICLLFLFEAISFRYQFRKYNYFLLKAKKENNNENNLPEILNINFENLIDEYDRLEMLNMDDKIPRPPKSLEEIKQDSFEGYLLRHFNVIKNNEDKIDFDRFLLWRKQIGTLLTREELYNIYNEITKDDGYCDIMEFILINKIIDEVDGADF